MSDETPQAQHVQRHLELQTELLRALLAEDRSSVFDIAVGDYHRQSLILKDSPAPGSRRVMCGRTGAGNDALAVPTTGVQIVPGNNGRLGLTIVNSGANALILYLTDGAAAKAGKPAIYLAANGGSWDGRLSNIVWCGNVIGVAQTAGTTITLAEV